MFLPRAEDVKVRESEIGEFPRLFFFIWVLLIAFRLFPSKVEYDLI